MYNNQRYKTALCKFYKEDEEGSCRMGEKCIFAHGEGELKESQYPKQNNYNNYNNNNYNGYGNNNGYGDNSGGYRKNYSNHKTVSCKFFERGDCKNGDNCNYAHGDGELKQPQRNFDTNENYTNPQGQDQGQGQGQLPGEQYQQTRSFRNQNNEEF